MEKLQAELQMKFCFANLDHVSYALDVTLHCRHGAAPDGGETSGMPARKPQPVAGESRRLDVFEHKASVQNGRTDVLMFEHFQAYSNIKPSTRHWPEDILANKGYATAALSLPSTRART
ncbi:hypothetical protein GQ53DRAFT_865728 [Thozetella sp. PMI_491]|nr:hypothetical protein GQ53DRAFT_865728 [Thozetella sp. PMI_491]